MLDPDLERVMRVLRLWFGPDQLEVLAVVVRGSGGLPPAVQPTLFPTIEASPAQVDPAVKGGAAAEGNP